MTTRISGEFKTNDELCHMIRWYWADKGYSVKAWVEMSDDYVPPRVIVDKKGNATRHDGFRARIPIIKSDLGPKGWPRRFGDGTPVYPELPDEPSASPEEGFVRESSRSEQVLPTQVHPAHPDIIGDV